MEQEQKDKFIELRAAGLSFDAISKQLNISKPTLLKLNRELAADIERLKFINMECLAEKYKMVKIARLESLGKVLEKVDSQIETADFSKLPIDKLLEVRFKLADKMQAELSLSYNIEKNVVSEMLDKEKNYTLNID